MSVVSFPIAPSELFQLSVEQYHELIDRSILTSDDQVELLEGVLFRKMPKNPPHETAVGNLTDVLTPLLPKGWHLRTQATITLSNGEPEPDGAVVRGTRSEYAARHPGALDVELLIEVSNSTLPTDRSVKLRSYARAGVPCYWIVNLIDRQIEVFTKPVVTDDVPGYAASAIFKSADSIPLEIGGHLIAVIPVTDILPGTG